MATRLPYQSWIVKTSSDNHSNDQTPTIGQTQDMNTLSHNEGIILSAIAANNQGHYAIAINLLESLYLLEDEHSYYDGTFMLAKIYQQHNDENNAIRCFNTIPASHPKYCQSQHKIADIYLRQHHWEQAIVHLKKIPTEKEEYIDTQMIIIESYCKLGLFENAIDWFEKIHEKTSDDYYAIMEAVQIIGEYEALHNHAIKYIKIIPEEYEYFLDAQVILGDLYLKTQQYANAIECFENITEEHGDFWHAQYSLGFIYAKYSSRRDEAIELLSDIPSDESSYLKSQITLSELYLSREDYLNAEKTQRVCLQLFRKSKAHFDIIQSLQTLRLIYLKMNRVNDGILTLYQLGETYYACDRLIEAENCFSAIPPSSHFFEISQYRSGILSHQRGALTKAIAHLRRLPEQSVLFTSSLTTMLESTSLLLDDPKTDEDQRPDLEVLQAASILNQMKYGINAKKRSREVEPEESASKKRSINIGIQDRETMSLKP